MKSRRDPQFSTEDRVLLHVCCAPCAMPGLFAHAPIPGLACYFYNPNIYPGDEHELRAAEFVRVSGLAGVPFHVERAPHEKFLEFVRGLESEPEGGARCLKCFEMRLSAAFGFASANGFTLVGTTLSTSPHKNVKAINAIGDALAARHPGVGFIGFDFKKMDGFKKSVDLCAKYGVYRQKYCGCSFSMDRAGSSGPKPGGTAR